MYSPSRLIKLLSKWVHSVGGGVLTLMMFLTAADVFLRYVFNKPILGSLEITEFMMVIIFALGVAYCTVSKSQIHVDLVFSRIPKKSQAILSSVTHFISLGIVSLLAWQVYVQARLQQGVGTISTVLEIPTYPFITVLAVGLTLLALALVVVFVESLYQVLEK